MGQSTDAILFYGYCWDDEHVLFEEDEDSGEWAEIVAKRRGISNPWDFYRSSGAESLQQGLLYAEQDAAFKSWEEEVGFETMLATWREEKNKIKAEYEGVAISSHCSCSYPMPYIYIESTELNARRGFPIEVTLDHITPPTADWDESLSRFVEDLDIDISEASGPGWFLVSMWC